MFTTDITENPEQRMINKVNVTATGEGVDRVNRVPGSVAALLTLSSSRR